MSKYIKPWRPLLFCSAQPTAFTARMPSDHMDTAQPSELACLPQEPQSHNEAQDLLLLQDYVCKLSHTQRTLEDTYALLQQTELLAGVINEQDCRAIRTACCCLKSLRIRRSSSQCNRTCSYRPTAAAHASERYNTTLQRTSTQLTQVARPGPRLNTSRTDLVPVRRMNARIPVPMWLRQQPWSTDRIEYNWLQRMHLLTDSLCTATRSSLSSRHCKNGC